MKKLIIKLRLWLIKKLKAIPGEERIEPNLVSATLSPVTLRVTRRLTYEEMNLFHDEDAQSWMTENIIKDLKRKITDEVIESGAIRIRYDQKMEEFSASIVLVLNKDRPNWL